MGAPSVTDCGDQRVINQPARQQSPFAAPSAPHPAVQAVDDEERAHHVSDEQHDNYFSIMDAAGIEVMAELSIDAHAVVLTIASKDDKFLGAVRELVAAARSAGYREALRDVLVIRDGAGPNREPPQ